MGSTKTLPPIYEQVREYLITKHKLIKLNAINKTSSIAADIITNLTIAVFFLITFLVLSLTLALLVAQLLHSKWEGFCCITILYLLIGLMINLFKAHLKNNLVHKFIGLVFRKSTQTNSNIQTENVVASFKHRVADFIKSMIGGFVI